MKKMKEEKKENNERWLLTYSDLITLLMIFFIVMFSTSNLDKNKYKRLSQSLNAVLDGGSQVTGSGNVQIDTNIDTNINTNIVDVNNGDSTTSLNSKNINKFKEEIDKIIKENDLSAEVTTRINERGLIISLSESILFESGKADIVDSTVKSLDKVANVLKRIDNNVSIEGHTDNIPIKNSEFSSNWQLSAMRAANICEYFNVWYGIGGERISSRGYGEFKPVSSNDTEEGRSKNRRVEIAIISW